MKKIVYLLVILISVVACKKENTAPTKVNGVVATGTEYDKLFIESSDKIDSVKHLNINTGVIQTFRNVPVNNITCPGTTNARPIRAHNLVNNHVTDAGYQLTIYFEDKTNMKFITPWIEVAGEDACNGYGLPLTTYDGEYTVQLY